MLAALFSARPLRILCVLCGYKLLTAKNAKDAKKILRNMELLVYSAFWCPDCRVAKRFLQKHNVPYKEIDIEATPGAADEVVARTGRRATLNLSLTVNGFSPTEPEKAFCTRRCPNFWVLQSLKTIRTSPSVP